MAISCTVFPMADALSQQLRRFTEWGDANIETTNKLIEQMMQAGLVKKEDVENGDVEKVLNDILAVTKREVKIGDIAQDELAGLLKDIQYARRVRVNKIRHSNDKADVEAYLKAVEEGKKKDTEYIYNSQHEYQSKGNDEIANVVTDLFKGSYLAKDKFTDAMVARFITVTIKKTVPSLIKRYKTSLAKSEDYLNRGLNEKGEVASREELTKLKEKISTTREQIKILQDEGWLGASRIPEVLSYSFSEVVRTINDAWNVDKFIKENLEKYEKNLEKTFEACREYFGLSTSIMDNVTWPFVKAYKYLPQLTKIHTIDKESGLSDEEIKKHNDEALDYRYILYDEMCRKLTALSDASFSVRMVQRKKDKDKQKQTKKDNEDKTEEKTNDIRNQEDEDGNENATEDNELTEEEDSEREIQFVSNRQRSVTSSLANKVKSVLGSLWEYRYDEKTKSFKFAKDRILSYKKLIPKGYAFMFLLRRFNQENNGKGLRNGEEVYDWLKKNEQYIPWLHGIVDAMDKDPYLKTQFFVAFYKAHQNFRVAKPAGEASGGLAQFTEEQLEGANFKDTLVKHAQSNNAEGQQMMLEIQDQVASGMQLTKGEVAVGNDMLTKVTIGTHAKPYQSLIKFVDISVYDENGNITKGELINEETGEELTKEYADDYREKTSNWDIADSARKGDFSKVLKLKAKGILGFYWFVQTRLDEERFAFSDKGLNLYAVDSKGNILYGKKFDANDKTQFYVRTTYHANKFQLSTYQQVLDERRPVLDDLLTALHALGVNCTMEELIGVCQGSGDKLRRIKWSVDNIAEMFHSWRGNQPGRPVFDHVRKVYQELANELSLLNKNHIEDNYRWNDKNYYCYGQRSFVTELVDELGDDENDKEWKEYVEKHYYKSEKADASFFYDKHADEDGDSFTVLNGILRDMDPDFEEEEIVRKNSSEEEYETLPKEKYQNYRRAFRDCDFNLGLEVKGWEQNRAIEYGQMTVAQKVMVEISNFFNPYYKTYQPLRNVAKHRWDENRTPNITKYALPIAADSNNHIFVGARAFFDFDSGSFVNDDISSYRKDGLLDRAADVIFSEFNRINCYSSNSVDGKPLPRPDLPKNFKKKMLEFCAYPELNDMQVAFSNEEGGYGTPMSFYKAMETFLSEGKDGQDFQLIVRQENGEVKKIDHKAGGRTNARELALTAVNILLNEYFKKDMDFWQEEGVFEYDEQSHFFSNLTTAEFQNAALQYTRRSAFAKEILDDNSEKGQQLKDQLRREGVYDFLVSFTDPRMGEVLYGVDEAARQQYIDAVEGTGAQEGYRSKLYRILGALVDTEKLDEHFDSYTPSGRDVTNDKYYNVLKLLGYVYNKEDKTWYYCDYREQKEQQYKKLGEKQIQAAEYYRDDVNKFLQNELKFNILNNNLIHLMKVYAMNKTSFKSQMTGLLVGDLAQFKDATDFVKRSKAFVAASERCDLKAVDPFHNNRRVLEYYGEREIRVYMWRENQKTITIQDFEAKANKDGTTGGFHGISQFFNNQLLPMLQKDLEAGVITEQEYIDYCSGYQGMTVSDGQSFRTLESMYKLMMMLGLGSEALYHIYEKVMKGGKLSFYEIQDYFAQMKTVAYDEQEVPIKYSVTMPDGTVEKRTYMQKFGDFIKDSQFTLMMYSDEMSEYLGKDSVLKGVLDFARENQIDVVHFGSTKKFGEFNTVSISECKNGAEARAKLQAAYDAGLSDKSKDIRHKESWARIGRQLPTKEHLVDKDQGIGTQLDKLIMADMPDSWWHYSINDPGQKEQSPTFVKLFNNANEILAKYTAEEFRYLVNTIKLLNMREDLKLLEDNFDTKEKLSQMLISAVDGTSKYADNVREALKINPETGDFNIPLDHPVIFDAIQTVIASAVRKHVIKQRTKGGTAVQFSSVGRTNALKTVYETDPESGQNRIKYVEAMLPAWSKNLFKAFAKPDGTLDINDIPEELRTMIGYRIPTEHLYSAVPIRVVGFLDSSQGASIMLPQEIVVWSGSDFDIDKIFLMRPDFTVGEDGKVYMGENLNADHPSFEELKNSTRLERDNLLLKLYYARLTSDFSCRDLARPGGFSAQKKMARIMNILANQKSHLKEGEHAFTLKELKSRQLNDTYDENGKLIEGLETLADKYGKRVNVLQGSFDDQMFKRVMTGSQMIGIYALHNAFHAVIQTAKIRMSEIFVNKCGFKINGRDMMTTLGEVFDEFGNSILRNIGGFLSAAVDNTKDPLLADLAQNPLTADLSLAFLHMGYSIETMSLIMNQPIVQKFLRDNRDMSSSAVNTKVRRYCKQNKITQMEADIDNDMLAAAITEGWHDGMENDKIQRSVMYMLSTMSHVSDGVRAIMNEIKITSPKDNMANTFGETLEKMKPVSSAFLNNRFSVTENGKTVQYPVFNEEEFDGLVMPDFDRGENEPMDVDVYMNGYEENGEKVRPRLPYVQMCYDAGFVRVQKLLKRHIPSLSTAMVDGIEKLKGMAYANNVFFKPALINAFVNEYKIYQAMNFAFKEDVKNGVSISEMRRAYLQSFPDYYRGVIAMYGNKEGKEKRDLRREFSILTSLKEEESRRLGKTILWMSSSGTRVTNRQLNEHVASWERMTKDKDPVIRNLAIQLYKYSVYYNGCTRELHGFGRFAPASILKEYSEYNDFLRNSANIPIPDRFIDQFIRNHASELSSSIIYKTTINRSDVRIPAFFEVKQVNEKSWVKDDDGVEQKVIIKKASYTPKEVVPASAAEAGSARYIYVTSPNFQKALYRRQETAEGDVFVLCGELGYKMFKEYDPNEELDWSIGFDNSAYVTEENLREALLEKYDNKQASKELSKKVSKQNVVFNNITSTAQDALRTDAKDNLVDVLYKDGGWKDIKDGNQLNLFTRLQNITKGLFSITLIDKPQPGIYKFIGSTLIAKFNDGEAVVKEEDYLPFENTFKKVLLKKIDDKDTLTGIYIRDNITTSNSNEADVTARLDYLEKNSDGTFSIAMPVFVPKEKYAAFVEATVGDGVDGKTDLSNVRKSDEAYLATTYVYALKQMLVNKYPDMNISDMMLVPITAEDVLITKKDGGGTYKLDEYEIGDEISIHIPRACTRTRDKMDNGLLHLPLNGDSVITSKPQATTKTVAATPSVPTGGAVTYREIFEKFLDEDALSRNSLQRVINKFDNIYTDQDIEGFKGMFGNKWESELDKFKREFYDHQTKIDPNGQYLLKTTLTRLNVSESVIEKLVEAIRKNHDIKGDDGVSLCRI